MRRAVRFQSGWDLAKREGCARWSGCTIILRITSFTVCSPRKLRGWDDGEFPGSSGRGGDAGGVYFGSERSDGELAAAGGDYCAGDGGAGDLFLFAARANVGEGMVDVRPAGGCDPGADLGDSSARGENQQALCAGGGGWRSACR